MNASLSQLLTPGQAKIDESIRTLKLEVEMAVRQVKGAVTDKEKALVDHDVMKLVGRLCLWLTCLAASGERTLSSGLSSSQDPHNLCQFATHLPS